MAGIEVAFRTGNRTWDRLSSAQEDFHTDFMAAVCWSHWEHSVWEQMKEKLEDWVEVIRVGERMSLTANGSRLNFFCRSGRFACCREGGVRLADRDRRHQR